MCVILMEMLMIEGDLRSFGPPPLLLRSYCGRELLLLLLLTDTGATVRESCVFFSSQTQELLCLVVLASRPRGPRLMVEIVSGEDGR